MYITVDLQTPDQLIYTFRFNVIPCYKVYCNKSKENHLG